MSAAQGIAFALQVSSSVVLARFLTPTQMGIFAVALAVVSLVSIFQQLNLSALIVREATLTPEITTTTFTINTIVTLLLSAAIALSSYVGEWFLGDPGVRRVLLVVAISPLFGIFMFLPSAHLERAARFKELSLINVISTIINTTATITFAVLGYSYMSIAYSQVISSGIYAAMLVWVGRHYLDHRIGFAAWHRVVQFSAQMVAMTTITTASTRLSDIVLGRLLGLGSLGLYNRAGGINQLLWNNIHSIAGRVVLVDFAAAHRQGHSLHDRYTRTVAIVTGLLWPAFAGLIVVADPLVRFVYGERWAAAVVPFQLLGVASVLRVSITMTYEVFTVTDSLRVQTRIEATRGLLSFALFVTGCMISLEAAAAARIIDATVALYLYRPHLNRLTDTRTRDFSSIFSTSALLAALAVAPAILALEAGLAAQDPLLYLIGSIIAGVLAWLSGLFALDHPIAQEIRVSFVAYAPRLRAALLTQ